MKKLLTTAAMFLCSLLTFAQFSGSGSGTENDPYLILNPIQLNQMRNFLNKEGVYFKLMADIDLTEFIEEEYLASGWLPIGTESNPFKGKLDGNGKIVKGLFINRPSTGYVGLFAYAYAATIVNLTVENVNINGKDHVGSLLGYGNCTIEHCTVSGSIYGESYVGGCVGDGHAIINDVTSTATVSGVNRIGGIIGNAESSISSCQAYSDVTGEDYVGGICGSTEYINLNDCVFVGGVHGNSYVGGLCGNTKATIGHCVAMADVTGIGNNIGGLAGYSYNNSDGKGFENSYFTGAVSGCEYTGGLVGYKSYGCITNCYANCSVAGTKSVGGLCGYIEGGGRFYAKCTSNAVVATTIKATEGGVGRITGQSGLVSYGELGTNQENKVYNRVIVIDSGVAQDITDGGQNGTGVSATTLRLKATYVAMGWDFTDTWAIQETECYPYFQTQTAPPVITSQLVSGAMTISGKCIDGGIVTLEIDGVKQEKVSTGNNFSFTVNPLQAGHEVRVSAKAENKEQSYYTTEIVSFLGKGTEADPYQVYTAADLTCVYRKGYYRLMNDIDLTEYINQYCASEGWESIGREGSETIHFDGNGHKVTGLWCNSTRDNTGLFSCFANGYIKNLTVETAKGKQVKGGNYTGIIIGKLINGEMTDCKAYGSVADGTPVGGMIGKLDGGKMLRCQSDVTINVEGENSYVGGLAGEVSGDVEECLSNGSLIATGKDSYVGGLTGLNNSVSTVANCYSNATTTSSLCAAGLIAYNYGVADKCYATGDIFSQNYGAGIVGYNDGENAVVKNCVATSNKIDVRYESQSAQSGGYGQRIIGGIKNGAPVPDLNNYALKTMQVSVNNVAQKVYDDIMNGVARTAEELLKTSTYKELGWDFTDVWAIVANESYPSLKNNEAVVASPAEEETPEPVISTSDRLTVSDVSGYFGMTASVAIGLANGSSDLVAYQFDLTLPEGITLAKSEKGVFLATKTNRYEDDSHSLSVSLLEGNTYRFICYSASSSKISGSEGALLNAIVTIDAEIVADKYEAQIANAIFTKVDGSQIRVGDTAFTIEVKGYVQGDANGDGEINVTDVVEIANAILGKPSSRFVEPAADVNGNGEINITDLTSVVRMILSAKNNKVRSRSADEYDVCHDKLAVTDENGVLQLCLDNEGNYSEMDIYSVNGQLVRNHVESLEGLPKGTYIINGKKYILK